MGNLITNMDVPKCANAEEAYLECTNYALVNLDLPNVSMYLDAGKWILLFGFLDTRTTSLM